MNAPARHSLGAWHAGFFLSGTKPSEEGADFFRMLAEYSEIRTRLWLDTSSETSIVRFLTWQVKRRRIHWVLNLGLRYCDHASSAELLVI